MNTLSQFTATPREESSSGILPQFQSPQSNRQQFLLEARSARSTNSDLQTHSCSPLSKLQSLPEQDIKLISGCINEIRSATTLTELQKNEIVTSLINDLSHPEKINQGVMATCVPTTLQFKLASSQPVQYTELIRDLAVKGSFTFNDPQQTTLTLNRETLVQDSKSVPPPFEERQITERMVQDLFMRYAVSGHDIQYDHQSDTSRGHYQGQPVVFKGLCKDHIERMINGVSGIKHTRLDNNGSLDTSTIVATIAEQLHKGKTLQVDLRYAASGDHQMHNFDVLSIKGDRVTLFNPWGAMNPPPKEGAIQEMSLSDFSRQLSCVFIDTGRTNDGKTSPPPAAQVKFTEPSEPTKVELNNLENIIQFHISPESHVESSDHSPSLQVVPLEMAKPAAQSQPDRETMREGDAQLTEAAAFAAASKSISLADKDRLRKTLRTRINKTDDNDEISD